MCEIIIIIIIVTIIIIIIIIIKALKCKTLGPCMVSDSIQIADDSEVQLYSIAN